MDYSAVVPVYNGEKYIVRTLLSLLGQRHPPMEIIVVDDGSTDGTAGILRDMAKACNRLRIHSLDENGGVSRARNAGIEQAAAPWCLLFDADDLADPDLAAVYAKEWTATRREGREPDMMFCATIQIDGEDRVIGGEHRFRPVSPDEMLGYLFVRNPIVSCSGVMVRRDAVLSLGGFDPALRYSEDWDLWLRMAHSHDIRYVDRVLCRIRRHGGNASSSIGRMLSGERQVLSRYDLSFIKAALFRRRVPASRNWIDLAAIAFRLDRWEEGLHYLERADEPSSSLDFYKGLYHLQAGRHGEAAEWFFRAMRKDEGHAAAANNYAGCMLMLGRKEEAAALLKELTRAWPAYMDAARNLRLALPEGGDESPPSVRFTWRELRSVLTVYDEKETD